MYGYTFYGVFMQVDDVSGSGVLNLSDQDVQNTFQCTSSKSVTQICLVDTNIN